MKFGLISLDFRRWPLERCFATAARYGYDGVEIWGGRPHAWPWDVGPKEVEEIAALRRRYDLETPMYTPAALGMGLCLCTPRQPERHDALRHFERAIDAAAALDITRVLVVVDHPGYDADGRESWKLLVDAAVALADYAAPKGVDLCFEPLTPLESPVLVTADDCVALLEDADRPNICTMLDVVPPTVVCEPLSSYFDKLGSHLAYVHLCGSDGVTDAHLELDKGVLSVPDALRTIKDCGYDGFVTVEQYSVSTRDPETLAAGTMRLLRSCLTDVESGATLQLRKQ